MNTLQKALQEYLAMRRALGFQLLDAGPAFSDVVSFLKRRRSSHITIQRSPSRFTSDIRS